MSTKNTTTDIINVNAILWVEVIPMSEAWEYKWQTAQPLIRGFWGVKQHKLDEGWVEHNSSSVRDKAYILKDGRFMFSAYPDKIFKKAHVKVMIQSGKYPAESIKYFDTDEEARAFAKEITAKMPSITVENK